jgi:heat-inducible transcriptional repressor
VVNRTTSSQRPGRPTPHSRRQAVLSKIIEEHLVSGDAVGSHTISDRFASASGWGSATIRSVMGELEDLGFLEQPHTSAGRVPTDKGYRYYVDNILGNSRLSKNDLKAIESISIGTEAGGRPDRLMEKASHVLSELSENVGIVVWPSFSENHLGHIRLVRLPDRRVLVVLVSTSNIVHDKVINLNEELTQDELNRAARYLNVEFSGKSLLAIRAEILELMREEKAHFDTIARNAMLLCERSLQGEDAAADVYLDGASNILTKPEFASTERIRELFRTFEEKSRLVKILNECVSSELVPGDVKVVIGRENLASSMSRCTVITSPYRVGAGVSGTLGVVGPMRIEYGRMMAVVNYLARFIERALLREMSLL